MRPQAAGPHQSVEVCHQCCCWGLVLLGIRGWGSCMLIMLAGMLAACVLTKLDKSSACQS
jgi:hypothetical protein